MNKVLVSVLRWAVALAMPVFLILTTARVVINDWFPRYEYAKPDFPRDRYGWNQAQRLELLLPTFHFLNSPLRPDLAIIILAAQHDPTTGKLLFTPSELSHMVDVKRLTDGLWRAEAVAGAVVVGGLAVLLARRRTRPSGYLALMVGGILTVAFLVLLALFMLTGFDSAFVIFHEIFFPQGNWTFDYSDSLIRMLPERFFYDIALVIAGGALGSGILAGLIGWALFRRTPASGRRPAEVVTTIGGPAQTD